MKLNFYQKNKFGNLQELSMISNSVLCYGLRVDFQGELFPGSLVLLSIADEMREIKTICHCGKKATMVARLNKYGKVITKGEQIQIGGNESYISLCRLHWREEIKNANINDSQF